MYLLSLLLLLVLGGCTSSWTAAREDKHRTDIVLEEMRVEIADLKHALHSAETEMRLLEDRVRGQETNVSSLRTQATPKLQKVGEISLLEKRVADLQKMQEKISADLRELAAHTNQTSSKLKEMQQEIAVNKTRLDEVVKLNKTTLSSLSKAYSEKEGDDPLYRRYKVKSGDSLEKIARHEGTTVEALKRVNGLRSDRIESGQELKIPD